MCDLSVILVNYNVKSYLEQALASIQKSLEGLKAEIFVVDNASHDGSVPMVRSRFPGVRLIVNPENAGFAKANNQAIRLASGRHICLINPDTLVREDTFRVCVAYLDAHADVGMVGGKVLNPDGTLQLACRRSFPTPWVAFTKVSGLSALFPKTRLFGRYNLTYLDPEQEADVEAISGSFMVVRKAVIDRVGLLDEQFFMYGEDLDWCYRIHRAGWKIVYLPDTQIVHYKGRSTHEASADALRLFYGAMALFVRKHFGRGFSLLPSWFLLAGIRVRGAVGWMIGLIRKLILPCVDLVFIQGALLLALLIRFGHLRHWMSYRIVDIVYSAVWLLCLAILGLYRRGVFSTSKAVWAVLIGLIFNASFTFFLPQYAYSRQVVLFAGLMNAVFLGGWRLAVRLASRMRWIPFLGTVGRTWLMRRAVILGTDSSAVDLWQRLKTRIASGYEVIGLVALKESDLDGGQPIPVLGTVGDLNRLVRRHQIHEVIFTTEAASYETILSVISMSKDLHIDYKMAPRDLDVLIGKTSVDVIEDIPLLDLDYRIYNPFNRILKRTGDLLFAGIFLILCLPVLVWTVLDPGIRWVSRRISDGQGGFFSLLEIRKKGQPAAGPLQLLPRMWAVFRGRMSLVGADILPYAPGTGGLGFKPGITGLVQFRSSETLDDAEKERMMLYYLKNYSVLLDMEIILRTLFH
ncbi:MAG TPA: glycosyltransferase [bacterium]|nr:glycosyltransferase [bacterium]